MDKKINFKKIAFFILKIRSLDYKFWLPCFISLIAVGIAIQSAVFVNKPFNLKVFNLVHLVPSSLVVYKDGMYLAVTYSFVNYGKSAGVIEDLYIDMTHGKDIWTKVHPVIQANEKRLVVNCNIDGNNLEGTLTPFVIGSEQSNEKTLLFALGNIQIGEYKIDTFVKINNEYIKQEPIILKVNESMLEDYLKGNLIFDIQDKYVVQDCERKDLAQ